MEPESRIGVGSPRWLYSLGVVVSHVEDEQSFAGSVRPRQVDVTVRDGAVVDGAVGLLEGDLLRGGGVADVVEDEPV